MFTVQLCDIAAAIDADLAPTLTIIVFIWDLRAPWLKYQLFVRAQMVNRRQLL